jgi:peptidylprolyl isomerase
MAARSIATLALGLFLGLIMGPSAVGDDKKDDKPAAPKTEDKKPAEGKTMELPKGTKGEIAVMETSQGTIKLKFFPDAAPKAVENFLGLSSKGYYNGVTFHRVIDGFMIQGGDPRGNGTGGQSLWQKSFEDEFSPKYRFDKKGILAMANAGPRTNGSQFFITLGPTPHLNDRHTIFGEVISGLDVVEKIGKVRTGAQNRPVEPVVMKKITIELPPAKPETKDAKKETK